MDADHGTLLHGRSGSHFTRVAAMFAHELGVPFTLVVGVVFARLPAESLLFVKGRAGMTGALAWLEGNLDEALARLTPFRADPMPARR